MKTGIIMKSLFFAFVIGVLVGSGAVQAAQEEDEDLLSKPRKYMGSRNCKDCHMQQYYSWQTTMHSRMIQDPQKSKSALVVELDEKRIRADLAKLGKNLKVPAEKIYIPKREEIKYTIGSKWKQRYIVEKEGTLYISPIQYNVEVGRFVNYHEQDWDKRPWLVKCGGCHVTGIDLEKQSFNETSIGCEACHGKGSWHFASPTTEFIDGERVITNPSKLAKGVASQICGSCHARGKATKYKGADWPVGYEPGMPLEAFFKSNSYAGGDKNHFYPNEFSRGHRQQYTDWSNSIHKKEGVTCVSCHYPHAHFLEKAKLYNPVGAWRPQVAQIIERSDDAQCLLCHKMINKTSAHAIHSFGKCVNCHMPRIVKSAEPGDLHSHVFVALLPIDTIKNPDLPNSCTSCHKHKDADLKKLQNDSFPGSMVETTEEGFGEGFGEEEKEPKESKD